MTTIAYRDGYMAADSQLSGDGVVDCCMIKIRVFGEYTVGCAGKAGVIAEFFHWFEKAGWPERVPTSLRVDDDHYPLCAMVVYRGTVWLVDGCGFPYEVTAPYLAIGSGRQFALGAMAMGATAWKAVEVAIQHDAGSGGEVLTVRTYAGSSGANSLKN